MPESLDVRQERTVKKSKLGRVFLLLLVVIILGVLAIKFYYDKQILPVSIENPEEIIVVIPEGSSTSKIAQILDKENLIRNKNIFRLVAKIKGQDSKLKAGNYVLNSGMTLHEILEKLVSGGISGETRTFTIPEGFELRQIAEKLSGQGIVDKEEFLQLASNVKLFSEDYEFLKEIPEGLTLEGYLFPETYEVYTHSTEEEIIKKMLDEFQKVYNREIKGKTLINNLDLNQLITLASIIEREGKVDKERPIMSSVFYNRIEKGMKLESCATVQYALGERKANLSTQDTRIESVYNTYIHEGLPPAPIASPGLNSIQAAINPQESDFLFFVLKKDGNGTHIFSTNYKDHLRAKNSN